MSAIEIVRVAGPAFVQDAGRPGRASEGVPAGGALVPEDLARANRAAGNMTVLAGIERFAAITIRAQGSIVLGDEAARRYVLADGEVASFEWDGAVRARYLGIAGGLAVPDVLGGRGTIVSVGLGGHEGRALRRGDVIACGEGATSLATHEIEDDRSGPIGIVAGPDLAFAPDALKRLVTERWTLSSRSDRTGTRLGGPPIAWAKPASAARTTPMIAGAIELPPSGEPIVLGPDNPTTGGYPVVALVITADLGRFHRLRLRGEVRFESGGEIGRQREGEG